MLENIAKKREPAYPGLMGTIKNVAQEGIVVELLSGGWFFTDFESLAKSCDGARSVNEIARKCREGRSIRADVQFIVPEAGSANVSNFTFVN